MNRARPHRLHLAQPLHAAPLAWLLFTAGCGFSPKAPTPSVDPQADQTQAGSAPPTAPRPLPATPPLPATSPLDPLGLATFGLDDADVVTALLRDQVVLDLLAPAGPTLDFSFLERLCLEGDDPDHFCHQRFGR